MLVYGNAINLNNSTCSSKEGIVGLLLRLFWACLNIPDHIELKSGTNSEHLGTLYLQTNQGTLINGVISSFEGVAFTN